MVRNNLGHLPVLLDVGFGTLHLGPGDGDHGQPGLGLRYHHTQLVFSCKDSWLIAHLDSLPDTNDRYEL